jgi:uncharacterized protein (TIGR02145 family)
MKITFILLFIFVHCIGFSQLGSWNNGSFKETDKKSANNLKLWNEGNQINYEEVSRNQNANGEVEVILNDLSGRSMQVRLTDKSSYWKLTNDANWTVLYDGSWSVKPSINITPVVNNPAPQTNIKEENCQAARNKYLEQNQDVKNANMDPWSHYTNYGKKEGRKWPSCEASLPTVNISLNPAPVSNQIVNSTNSSVSHKPAANIKSVQIGTQTWMVENLNVSTFRNGDLIPEAKTEDEWRKAGESKQPAWCYYGNEPANGTKYGKLYNWYAVNDPRGLAPAGWHVPSKVEFEYLAYVYTKILPPPLDRYGSVEDCSKLKSNQGWLNWQEGGQLIPCSICASWNKEYRSKTPCHSCKDTRDSGRRSPVIKHSGNGNNESGFSALPGGHRDYIIHFSNLGDYGYWWSSNESSTEWYKWYDGEHAISYSLNNRNGSRLIEDVTSSELKEQGFSVRCVKD